MVYCKIQEASNQMLRGSMGSFLKILVCLYMHIYLYITHYTLIFMCKGFVEKVPLGKTCKGGGKQVRAREEARHCQGSKLTWSYWELWSGNGTIEPPHLEARGSLSPLYYSVTSWGLPHGMGWPLRHFCTRQIITAKGNSPENSTILNH